MSLLRLAGPRVAALLAVISFAAEPAPAQNTPFRSGVEVVTVTATVLNADGSFVPRLTLDDFRLAENGVPQTIAYFSAERTPADVVFLIDTSSSMSEQLSTARKAVAKLAEALAPGDRTTVLTFGGLVRQLMPLTDDRAAFTRSMNKLKAAGMTPLYDAIYIGLKAFGAAPTADDIRRRALVVLTDGDDTASMLSYDTVLRQARLSGVAIYPVSLRSATTPRTEQTMAADYELRALATETGARAFFTEQGQLLPTYQSIATELAHQYCLGYVPDGTPEKRGFVRLSVAVDRPNVVVRSRSGYIAGAVSGDSQ